MCRVVARSGRWGQGAGGHGPGLVVVVLLGGGGVHQKKWRGGASRRHPVIAMCRVRAWASIRGKEGCLQLVELGWAATVGMGHIRKPNAAHRNWMQIAPCKPQTRQTANNNKTHNRSFSVILFGSPRVFRGACQACGWAGALGKFKWTLGALVWIRSDVIRSIDESIDGAVIEQQRLKLGRISHRM